MPETKKIKTKCDLNVIKGFFINATLNVVLSLKYQKIDIDKRDCKSNTLLHYAAQSSSKKNITFLLTKGADPNALNENGHTPLSLGLKRKFSNEKSLKLLLLAGANLLMINEDFENSFFGIRTLRNCTDLWIAERLLAQAAIYEALGHSVEKLIKTMYDLNVPRLKSLYGLCRESLRRLKTHKIRTCNGNDFTMFTILSERPEKVARYVKDDDWPTIASLMASYNWETMNFYYREALKKYVKDVRQYKSCREKATQVVRQFTGLGDSHYLVVNKIVNCFSARDLLIFK